MDDTEYQKYLNDMQELDQLRRVKADFPKNAREWFDDINLWFGKGGYLGSSEMRVIYCAKEKADGYKYCCDLCPFPAIFGCPFGYEVYYSK
jgi:hypothetical protein